MKTVILALAVSAALHAGAVTPLDSLVVAAVAADPGRRAVEAESQARTASLRADNLPEAPEVDFEYLWGAEQNRWSAGVSQRIDWPGLYRARAAEANAVEASAAVAIAARDLDRALQAKLAVLDIIDARARLTFYEQLDSNLNVIADMTRRSFDLGEATILDLRKTRLAVIDSRRQVESARADLAAFVAALEAMNVVVPPSAASLWNNYPVQVAAIPSDDPADYPQGILAERRRQLAAATRRTVAMGALPSLSLGYVHAYEDRNHFNGLSISIALPSWGRSRRMKVAQLEAEADLFVYDASTVEAIAQARGRYRSALALDGAIDEYRSFTGDNSYLGLLKTAFDSGELTVIDYLTEINLFTSSRLGFLDLLYRYNTDLAYLNRYRSLTF